WRCASAWSTATRTPSTRSASTWGSPASASASWRRSPCPSSATRATPVPCWTGRADPTRTGSGHGAGAPAPCPRTSGRRRRRPSRSAGDLLRNRAGKTRNAGQAVLLPQGAQPVDLGGPPRALRRGLRLAPGEAVVVGLHAVRGAGSGLGGAQRLGQRGVEGEGGLADALERSAGRPHLDQLPLR